MGTGAKRNSRRMFRSFVLMAACAGLLGVIGCFGRPPSPNDGAVGGIGDILPERPAESGALDASPRVPAEGPVEEPIRPIGKTNDEGDSPVETASPDINGDGVLDESDQEAFMFEFGLSEDQEGFTGAADLDGDGVVTLVDFQLFLTLIGPASAE